MDKLFAVYEKQAKCRCGNLPRYEWILRCVYRTLDQALAAIKTNNDFICKSMRREFPDWSDKTDDFLLCQSDRWWVWEILKVEAAERS